MHTGRGFDLGAINACRIQIHIQLAKHIAVDIIYASFRLIFAGCTFRRSLLICGTILNPLFEFSENKTIFHKSL